MNNKPSMSELKSVRDRLANKSLSSSQEQMRYSILDALDDGIQNYDTFSAKELNNFITSARNLMG